MRSAGAARALVSLVSAPALAATLDEMDARFRAETHEGQALLRSAIGVEWSPPRGLTADETSLLGICVHECSHLAVALACGDVVESVSISRGTLSGRAPYWPRASRSVAAVIARVAVSSAGVHGFDLATGDLVGAYDSGHVDRIDVDELLEREDLTHCANAVQYIADRIVDVVLSDPKVWRATTELAFRLIDRGRIEGVEIERAIRIPRHVRTRVARLLDLKVDLKGVQ